MTELKRAKFLNFSVICACSLLTAAGIFVTLRGHAAIQGLLSQAGSRASEVNPVDGLTYVWIPPGSLQMGCPPRNVECDGEGEPPRRVVISKGFLLGESEVTQGAFERVTGKKPSHFTGDVNDRNRPVEQVTWDAAKAYCNAIGGRLPSDVEWQYSVRAGGLEAIYGPLDKVAWYAENSGRGTHPVKQKLPNSWGLYDMIGNVAEWVGDSYPLAEGQVRALRGGAWEIQSEMTRHSVRAGFVDSEFHDDHVGFRCAWK